MKQYLLIPIEEISKRISYLEREIDNNLGSVLADYDSHEKQILERLHQKGEIVEDVPHTYGKDYKLIKTIKQ